MKLINVIAVFFLISFFCRAQQCNIKKEFEKISELNLSGNFSEAILIAEPLIKCANIGVEDKIVLCVLQHKLHRNSLKFKESLDYLIEASLLYKQIGLEPPISFNLLLAESFAINGEIENYRKLLPKIEAEMLQVKVDDNFKLGHFEYVKSFNMDRDRYSSQHMDHIYKALSYFEADEKVPVYHRSLILRSLGHFYRTQGDFDKSLDFYNRELAVWSKVYNTNHFNIATSHYSIGCVYYEKLEYQNALDHYLKAHKVWKNVYQPENPRMRGLNEAMGDMYWELDDPKKALEYFNYAVVYEEMINNDSSEGALNAGDSLLNSGEYAAAINYYEEAVKWREQTYGKNHILTGACKNFVARALNSAGNKEDALTAYQEAIIILVKDFEDLSWYANPTVNMRIQSPQYLLEALMAKGSLLKDLYHQNKEMRDLMAALETQELAIQVLEKIKNNQMSESSKLFWSNKTISLIENAIDTALLVQEKTGDNKYFEKALNFSERSKALLLLATLNSREISSFVNFPEKLVETENQLKQEITQYAGRIESEEKRCAEVREKMLKLYTDRLNTLQDEYDAFIIEIEHNYPDYYQLKYDSEIPGLTTIQEKLLTKSRNLLSYFLGIENSFVFYITPEDITVRRITNKPELNNQAKALLNFVGSTDINSKNNNELYKKYIQNAFLLYQQLLQPEFKKSIPEQLIIIPDGVLAYIPFETLLTENVEIENPQYARLPYLLKQTAVSYCPSTSVALHFYENETHSIDYYGFAPEYDMDITSSLRKKQKKLNYNQPEVTFAAQLFKGKSWTGENVTEDLLKEHSGNAGILHLAMHGEVEDEHPLLSKLYFNTSENEDGLLNTYEVYNLNIPAQLVILSACNTASGLLQRGEGILSLERAFQYAGSKSMVATLWSVDDAASFEITQNFLINLKTGQSKDVALQQAKLAFIETANPEKVHPFYWSSFKLSGNTAPLKRNFEKYYIIGGAGLLLLLLGIIIYRRKNAT
ncbi:CHAT domain-containing protein [Aequorivita sp. F47161]|uniref:CHAT domain-containing protein n=1 Tax=Aequorivita vitellina TaxID=2874475 RepID=A0A9X1QRX6_9FLAO|nr:CHAT domain-containing tetratricopeptide repeat protein [Aequorivita vitellina]MCG2417655.1 CHAT domain-containing protein [Aequorivita vitellina]